MESDANQIRSEFQNVMVPRTIFGPVNEILDGLNRKVLLEAARAAKAKVPAGEACTIDQTDVLNAIRAVLADATADIEKALGSDDAESLRRRAS